MHISVLDEDQWKQKYMFYFKSSYNKEIGFGVSWKLCLNSRFLKLIKTRLRLRGNLIPLDHESTVSIIISQNIFNGSVTNNPTLLVPLSGKQIVFHTDQ